MNTGYVLNGKEVTEEEFRAHGTSKLDDLFKGGETLIGQSPAGWPKESLSMGVHPDQRAEAYEASRAYGVPTDFAANGNAIFTDPGHMKRYMKAKGYVDMSDRNNTSKAEDCTR